MFQLKIVIRLAICSAMLTFLSGEASPQVTDSKLRIRLFDSETGFPVPVPLLHTNMTFAEAVTHRAGEIDVNPGRERGVLILSAPGYPELKLSLNMRAAMPAIQVYTSKCSEPIRQSAVARTCEAYFVWCGGISERRRHRTPA